MNLAKKFIGGATLAVAAISSTANAATFVGDRTDFRDETIYFAMTTRFYDGDITNNTYCWDGKLNVNDPEWRGDFKGLIEKLDYIKALGFTAVWITPVVENASGLDYHGYHAINFDKVDPRYESEDCKFQDLIDAAHARGMKIILDIVLQHTGNFGEEHLCPMFTKDYTQNMSNINKSMLMHKDSKLPANYFNLPDGQQYSARLALMKNTDGVNHDTHNYWHHYAHGGWDDPSRWWMQIAGDCVDLNTENAYVTNYLVKCYTKFIDMGVDGFRIDTGGHISRLTFNKMFIPQLHEAAEKAKAKRGGTPFFMYSEVCARAEEVIYRGENYNCSPCFYTWKEEKDYAWDMSETSWDSQVVMEGETGTHPNALSVLQQGQDYLGHASMARSNNAWLDGNNYRTEDYTKSSGLNVIDFAMHWRFHDAKNAYGVRTEDDLYNDARYNVMYVDSHDYGPNGQDGLRFAGGEAKWAQNLNLMFTFRGIPCIYYGSEIQFQAGKPIDKGPDLALKDGGRAYFGGYITGDVNVSDFATYTNATGNMAATLSNPLALHIQRLNKIRAAVPALRKGQYSTTGCSGDIAFKRRYVDANTDSYVLVAVNGNASFTGVLNGTYTECVTGETKTVTDGTLSTTCPGSANLRVWVLSTSKTPAPGKIGEDGKYLYATSAVNVPQLGYDGNEEAPETVTVKDTASGGSSGGNVDITEPDEPITPSMSEGEQAVFFENDKEWGGYINAYVWNGGTTYAGAWSGSAMTYLGNKVWKWTYTGTGVIPATAGVIFNNGGSQTDDFTWINGGYYTSSGYQRTIEGAGEIVAPPVTPDGPFTVYYDDSKSNWGSVNVYMWDDEGELVGKWPGTAMTETATIDGVSYKSYTYTPTRALSNAKIIFNGNGQTADLALTPGGIYNVNGLQGSYSAVETVATATLEIKAAKGALIVRSDSHTTLSVAGVDGIVRTLNVRPGNNRFELPRGFYIVNGNKYML
ncbi:MAG: starch-binding protein [Muribaculaceae bacterium]|nr:starch-binding protein [Muribaculaceae bacterium]